MMKQFLGRIPKAREWIKETHRTVREHGYLETLYGRRRRFPLITSRFESSIMRQAQNFPVQSVASDLTLESLVAMNDAGMEIVSTVHDSIMLYCDPDDLNDILREAQRLTANIARERIGDEIPFPIEAKVGHAWGKLEEVEMPK
jgi:DNA polymerase-1